MNCRSCNSELSLEFIDLGKMPPSNAYLTEEDLLKPETTYPLRVLVCEKCWLVQTEDCVGREEVFDSEYAYFSSYSTSWLKHCEEYVDSIVARLELNEGSRVVEVASNDGYLLQYFKDRLIPCLGVEPTASTADAARGKGLEIVEEFFGVSLAEDLKAESRCADLMIANNVLAHVPDINDFVQGLAVLLKDDGVATFEFPYLMQLVEKNQFDTIYHEHFSYLSFIAVMRIFSSNGLKVFDVEELSTHGGSLRVYAERSDHGSIPVENRVAELLDKESSMRLDAQAYYASFQEKALKVKNDFLDFLLDAKRQGKTVAAYGAAAKGNTLLNFAGIKSDLIDFVVDRNPAKQGKYLPGSRIKIVDESVLQSTKPDYVVILPWNLKQEIVQQLSYAADWGGRFVTAVPELSLTS